MGISANSFLDRLRAFCLISLELALILLFVYRFDTDATGRPASPFRPDPIWWKEITG